MKKLRFLFMFLCCMESIITTAQVPFTAGSLVVLRIGDGSSISQLNGLAAPLFLDEFSTTGSLIQSVSLPTTPSGANKTIALRADEISYGTLTISPNRHYLALYGYDAPVGTSVDVASVSNTIGRIDFNASINSSTQLLNTDIPGNVPYGVITNDGNQFWTTNSGGIRYHLLGSSSSTEIVSIGGALRTVDIFNGQLYFSSNKAKVGSVGSGLPATGPQSFSIFPGIPNADSEQGQAFFADMDPTIPGLDVVYIANAGDLAVTKYSYSPVDDEWESNGQVGIDEDDYKGITGSINGTTVSLFCTRKVGSGGLAGGELVSLTDASGYNGAFTATATLLATAPTNTVFRGVAFSPKSGFTISAKTFLQGAYSAGLSRHKDVTTAWAAILNANALHQPYNTAAFGNYAGSETVPAGFFKSTAATTDIVDWVLLELRSGSNPATVVSRRAAFICEDGKIVDVDGVSDPSFAGVTSGNSYYLVIRHRNHLPVRTAAAFTITDGVAPVLKDFTALQSNAFQDPLVTTNAAMKDLGGGVFGMWAGNVNSNTNVKYQGVSNDAVALLAALGANYSATLSNVYNAADVNLDGSVKYQGVNNDAVALLGYLNANYSAVLNQHQ